PRGRPAPQPAPPARYPAPRRQPGRHQPAGYPAPPAGYPAPPAGNLAPPAGYLAGIVDGPTFTASQLLSGRAARRKPAMWSLAAAVSSQGSGGHSRQATMPL